MANIIAGGATPELPVDVLHDIGFSLAAYPLSLMAAAMQAMVTTLRDMRHGARTDQMDFVELRKRIGFDDYYETSENYGSSKRDT